MKKRKFADGGVAEAMAQMQRDKALASGAGPSSGVGSPSMGSKRPTSADALRYLRATGNKAGADEILKAAVGKPAKMPDAYSRAFSKSGTLSPQQSAQAAMLERQKAGPQTPAGAVKPASSGIVSSSKEALDKMPEGSLFPTIPAPIRPPGASMSDADMRELESMARSTPQPGPRAPVSAPAAPVDRGPPMVAPGSPVNPGGPSMGLGSTSPGSAQPSMGPAPTMRTPVRPTSPAQMMKKGGQVKPKAYASGGTVRGSGIAQRGVKKCKIY